jgi:hypothetical protein
MHPLVGSYLVFLCRRLSNNFMLTLTNGAYSENCTPFNKLLFCQSVTVNNERDNIHLKYRIILYSCIIGESKRYFYI